MNYTFKKQYGSSVDVEINNELVLFEAVEQTDGLEYSEMWFMDGYVHLGDKYWQKKYQAIGEFEKGSDNFVQLTDIVFC